MPTKKEKEREDRAAELRTLKQRRFDERVGMGQVRQMQIATAATAATRSSNSAALQPQSPAAARLRAQEERSTAP